MTTFDTGHALLIGIGSYANAPQLNIPVAAEEARVVAAVLGDHDYCGYPKQQIATLLNSEATRAAILEQFGRLAQQARENDTVIIFYSGHGEYAKDGTYYLTTHDSVIEDGYVRNGTAIGERDLLQQVRALPAKRVLLIFSVAFSRDVAMVLGDEEEPIGASIPERTVTGLLGTGDGRVVMSACCEDQRSYYGPSDRLTIFGQALADGLKGSERSSQQGYIGSFDLYDYAFKQVSDQVKRRWGRTQEPQLTIQQGVGSIAVGLYHGQALKGGLGGESAAPAGSSVRKISIEKSRAVFNQLVTDQYNVGSVQSGGINFGVGNSIGRMGDIVAGDKVAGDKIAGDKIDARGSQGYINRPTGPTTQVFGSQHNVNTGGGDYAEGNIDKRGGTSVQGDQLNTSGNFQDSIVNIKSTLSNVTQSIGAMSGGDARTRDEIRQLVDRLSMELQRAPADHVEDAEAVAEMAKQVIGQAFKEKPNKTMLQISIEGLKQAASNVAAILPAVLPLAQQIVQKVMTLTI